MKSANPLQRQSREDSFSPGGNKRIKKPKKISSSNFNPTSKTNKKEIALNLRSNRERNQQRRILDVKSEECRSFPMNSREILQPKMGEPISLIKL
jgi:hypothetical protein